MLTSQQRSEFSEKGFTRVGEAFPPDVAEAMVDRIWSYLDEQQNMRRSERASWVEGGIRGLNGLKQHSEFQRFASPMIVSVINDFLGEGNWSQPSMWGQILVTFPAVEWNWNSLFQGLVDVETVTWHTDYPYDVPPNELVGVQIFALLADLDSGGGGTMVVEGSHRLIRNFVNDQPTETLAKMKRARVALMRSHPWLESISKAVSLPRPEPWIAEQKTVIDDIPLAVTELTGKAGDVYFTHPWLLHATSPNCNETPRMMSTQRIRKKGYES